MRLMLPALFLFLAAAAMALAGWRIIVDGRQTQHEIVANEAIIQALQIDAAGHTKRIEFQDRELAAQRQLLLAAEAWMAARKALPAPSPPGEPAP
jgi:predicted amidohydrolase YtcJ